MSCMFKSYDQDQLFLLPPSLREWLPGNHLAQFISDVVDELDIQEIERVYSNTDRMKRLLMTKKGKKLYGKRKETVEPVFGQIKEERGFRRFLLRGLEKVRAEWSIICMTHNLLKLYRWKVAKTGMCT